MPELKQTAAEERKLIALARERYAAAKSAWSDRFADYRRDLKAVNVKGGQWDDAVRAAREAEGRPALEFNELHTYVQQITNRARQERPQPKINPGDDGDPQTATVLEDKLRHIQYASQADIAYDCAVEASATGGFGFYEITQEYVTDLPGASAFHQEPRVRRILDPTTVYFDPNCVEADYSDADYCFRRKRVRRDDFKGEYGAEPMAWEADADPEWCDEEHVWIAAYWHVERRRSTLCQLTDGSICFKDELGEEELELIANERPVVEKTIYRDIIDGEKVLESKIWPCQWIGIVPVLGREVVVEGNRLLISAVRFALDAQKLKNAYKSGIAEMIGTANFAPFIGYKGQFKDGKWRSGKKHFYLEVEPVAINGQTAPLPTRNNVEPPIQAMSAAALQETDDIKRAVGYVDNILRPSQADISGIAVTKRDQQAELTNFHFEDNLVRSQWHAGRVMLDLLLNLTDTPRAWRTMREDGTVNVVPVTMAGEDGQPHNVAGYDGRPHYRIDQGQYDVTISTGPSYARRQDEERDVLLRMAETNPATWQVYGDIIMKILGYADLEERAKLALAPQIQQAISSNMDGVPPQARATIAVQQSQIQQMGAVLQKVMTMLQTKQIETKGKLDVEKLKLIRELMVTQMQHTHEATALNLTERSDAVEHMLNLLHESELAPDPNAPPAQSQAA